VASPAYTVLVVGEQPVSDLFIGIGTFVHHESPLLRDRRRKTDEIKIDTPQKGQLVRRTCGLKTFLFMFLRDKCVDRFRGFCNSRGYIRANNGSERPKSCTMTKKRERDSRGRPAATKTDEQRWPSTWTSRLGWLSKMICAPNYACFAAYRSAARCIRGWQSFARQVLDVSRVPCPATLQLVRVVPGGYKTSRRHLSTNTASLYRWHSVTFLLMRVPKPLVRAITALSRGSVGRIGR
jgi:hypothetical protein